MSNKDKDEDKYPDNVMDKEIYDEAKRKADESYKRHSAYKSMYIAKMYKKLNGRYKKSSKPRVDRTKNWLKEEWIQIKPYLKDKTKETCGRNDGKPNACRPIRNIKGGERNITMEQILKKWGKPKVKALLEIKLKDMDGSLNWKNGTFLPSKKTMKVKIVDKSGYVTEVSDKDAEEIYRKLSKEKKNK